MTYFRKWTHRGVRSDRGNIAFIKIFFVLFKFSSTLKPQIKSHSRRLLSFQNLQYEISFVLFLLTKWLGSQKRFFSTVFICLQFPFVILSRVQTKAVLYTVKTLWSLRKMNSIDIKIRAKLSGRCKTTNSWSHKDWRKPAENCGKNS